VTSTTKCRWRRGVLIAAMAAAVLAVGAGCGSTSATTPSPSPTAASAPAAVINPAPGWPARLPSDFVRVISNPWFPLRTGTTWVSRGVKDGKPTVDTYAVTGQTKLILGVTCSVIKDTLTAHGKVIEQTSDWYTQDRQGNVWYFGEDTAEYNAAGQVTSTSGTWQAGVAGARPGIFMPANPQIGMGGYQEYLPGQALDHYTVVSLGAPVRVPYGSFAHALTMHETTALEPGVLDGKAYVKGIGQVAEQTIKGAKETSLLVRYVKR
jgi:hypothetical protein